jgi:catechol 2,3-dioxygenase-like lactoylglutathione lyase family enzyme
MKVVAGFVAGLIAGAALVQIGVAQVGVAPLADAQSAAREMRPERAVNHIGIVVDDYAAAYDFYTQTLGFREAYTVDRNGAPLLTYLQANRETFVELIPARGEGPRGVTHFGLEVADIDSLVAHLRSAGMAVADPGVTPANARFVRVRDPDNVEIEIMEFGPEASQYKAMQAWRE